MLSLSVDDTKICVMLAVQVLPGVPREPIALHTSVYVQIVYETCFVECTDPFTADAAGVVVQFRSKLETNALCTLVETTTAGLGVLIALHTWITEQLSRVFSGVECTGELSIFTVDGAELAVTLILDIKNNVLRILVPPETLLTALRIDGGSPECEDTFVRIVVDGVDVVAIEPSGPFGVVTTTDAGEATTMLDILWETALVDDDDEACMEDMANIAVDDPVMTKEDSVTGEEGTSSVLGVLIKILVLFDDTIAR